MQFVVVTGMSGAGKSTALRVLEDYGFFCVDNLPPPLLPKFTEVCALTSSEITKAAFGIDIRGGHMFGNLPEIVDELKKSGGAVTVLFLECEDETLVKRFKETRRSHPLSKNDRIETGIEKERELLYAIKKKSDYIMDTTHFLTRQLREQITDIFLSGGDFKSITITALSFGFKYGIPSDADLVFDVRFIPNPFYTKLRPLTGLSPEVRDFVLSAEGAAEFLEKLNSMLDFLLPRYVKEGKNALVVAIGCTGGKHRSVCLAQAVYEHLKDSGQSVIVSHRDMDKDS
ncbi:MAG: RNase adapter RapZ [Clostridiales bacterium]|jgi:UPF0042 nucleotide-binding protein|nr:RNase adapter RapZ [Clostridiales bacterium]